MLKFIKGLFNSPKLVEYVQSENVFNKVNRGNVCYVILGEEELRAWMLSTKAKNVVAKVELTLNHKYIDYIKTIKWDGEELSPKKWLKEERKKESKRLLARLNNV